MRTFLAIVAIIALLLVVAWSVSESDIYEKCEARGGYITVKPPMCWTPEGPVIWSEL